MRKLVIVLLTLALPQLLLADENKVDWDKEFITAKGMCAIRSKKPYHRIVAREKARIRAERDALGTVKSLKIDANTTMVETLKTSDYKETIIRKISGVLKGAAIKEEKVIGDVYHITMAVPLSEVRKALLLPRYPHKPISIRNPYVIPSRNFAAPASKGKVSVQVTDSIGETPSVVVEEEPTVITEEGDKTEAPPADAPWKGLIVDARGLSAEEAFWPRLLDEKGEVVYGNYDATSDFLQDKGPVKYVTSLSAAHSCGRVDSPAYKAKAKKTAGQYSADLVLSQKTADEIRELENNCKFLRNFKVVIVID